MGNCVRKDSSAVQWGGEEWSPWSSPVSNKSMRVAAEDESTLLARKTGLGTAFGLSSSAATTIGGGTEVKIKITKKQLQEILGKADVEGLPLEQVLTKLMKVSEKFETHPRHWRPALQSIPEVEF